MNSTTSPDTAPWHQDPLTYPGDSSQFPSRDPYSYSYSLPYHQYSHPYPYPYPYPHPHPQQPGTASASTASYIYNTLGNGRQHPPIQYGQPILSLPPSYDPAQASASFHGYPANEYLSIPTLQGYSSYNDRHIPQRPELIWNGHPPQPGATTDGGPVPAPTSSLPFYDRHVQLERQSTQPIVDNHNPTNQPHHPIHPSSQSWTSSRSGTKSPQTTSENASHDNTQLAGDRADTGVLPSHTKLTASTGSMHHYPASPGIETNSFAVPAVPREFVSQFLSDSTLSQSSEPSTGATYSHLGETAPLPIEGLRSYDSPPWPYSDQTPRSPDSPSTMSSGSPQSAKQGTQTTGQSTGRLPPYWRESRTLFRRKDGHTVTFAQIVLDLGNSLSNTTHREDSIRKTLADFFGCDTALGDLTEVYNTVAAHPDVWWFQLYSEALSSYNVTMKARYEAGDTRTFVTVKWP